jgi:hypothetical protein
MTCTIPKLGVSMKIKLLSAFLGLFCLLLRAGDPVDQYISVFNLIQRGDTLADTGQINPALAKYQAAQSALSSFQKSYPDWNTKIVTYRMNYLGEKIAALTQKASQAPAATAAGQAGAGAPGTGSAGAVKLLEAGAEPRVALRLHPKAGDTQSMKMTIKVGTTISVGGNAMPAMKLPAMNILLNNTVKDVSQNGDISSEMVIADASVPEEAEADAMPQAVEAIKSSLNGMKGLTVTATFTSRGQPKETEVKMPTDASPQVRQTMGQMKEMFSQGATVFPEEPVGPGARWEIKQSMKSQGMTIQQTTTNELVSVDGDKVTTKSSLAQQASKQQVESPLAPGMKVNLLKMSGAGTGNTALDLTQMLPVEAMLEQHSALSMTAGAGNQQQAMDIKLDMNMTMRSN